MLQSVQAFLNRPLSEDFSLRHQAKLSAQAVLYVFVFLFLFMGGNSGSYPRWLVLGTLAAGCGLSSLAANVVLPALFPAYYDEERWTVKRHIGHVLLVLLFVAMGNQAVLSLLGLASPTFLMMYLLVTAIGFFPVSLGIMLAEQRRLKRNLAQAEALNRELDRLHNVPTAPPAEAVLPRSISLASESGKDRLNLLPNQLIYVESVGNYVEVHWLNFMFPQKTVLRSTLKDVEAALADQPQFFRCHRAFIVNLRAVSYTTGNARGYQLTMSGSNREIPVSRTYVPNFDQRMADLAAA
ncbi:LytR/AlgR family response regulator transcription factor [Fibrella sp. WM1]|uniref:LytR/AlgR family response regulator transcription factor n=1 Tax=Fibrella musci TaxID=3242485 RepID=UPI00352281B8